jgi:hypothetical protein
LDLDVSKVHFCLSENRQQPPLASYSVRALYAEPRPVYCTAPWLTAELQVAEEVEKIGVWCEDEQGNRGEVAWAAVEPPPADQESGGRWELWAVPPTEQVPRNAPPPAHPQQAWELVVLRGEARSFQLVVRPHLPLQRGRITFEPLRHEDGKTELAPRWLAYHFVDYVHLEKNSVATPAEELVWPAPADYPDELADDLTRDLPAEQNQPIFIRVTAPLTAKPGLYRGRAWFQCAQGRQPFTLTLRVLPLPFPQRTDLKFVYWMSWDAPCREFAVKQFSEDGWRVLRRLGELMHAYHQNSVVVSYALIRVWQKADGSLVCDFRDFDRFLRTFQQAGVDRLFCISHIGSRETGEWECPTMRAHTIQAHRLDNGEPVSLSVLDLLPALQQHLEELGLLDRTALHIADEPIPANVESYRQLAAEAHRRAPKLRRIDAIHVPDLRGALEIWVPQLNYFEQWLSQYRAAQQEGYEIWFYVAWVPQGHYPNRMIDSHAIKPRILHWLNFLCDTSGYLHWALNHWGIPLASLGSPGDQYICWPSRRFVADSSLRYEAEREGLQDCQLMFMLRAALQKRGLTRQAAQARVEQLCRPAVQDIQHYTRSWHDLEAVRQRLLDELMKVSVQK